MLLKIFLSFDSLFVDMKKIINFIINLFRKNNYTYLRDENGEKIGSDFLNKFYNNK